MKLSVKRAAASSPDSSSASRVVPISSSAKPRAPSLRSSSRRLCSRRASRSSAARSHAAESATSGLERRTLLLDGLDRGLPRQDLRANLLLDVGGDVLVVDQELARVLLALPDPVALVAEPGARLLDDVLLHAEVDDLAFARDADAVEDLEFRGLERRRDLVLDDLDACLAADDLFALLDRADTADVEPHGRVELQRVAAGRGLGVAEHHTDLHADLVDEDHEGVRTLDVAGELAQRLRHEPRLEAHVLVAHLP